MAIQVCYECYSTGALADLEHRDATTTSRAQNGTKQRLETYVSRRHIVNARLVGVSFLCCLGLVDQTIRLTRKH